eukprot:190732-Chlamydomonas_euryale.AAC.22
MESQLPSPDCKADAVRASPVKDMHANAGNPVNNTATGSVHVTVVRNSTAGAPAGALEAKQLSQPRGSQGADFDMDGSVLLTAAAGGSQGGSQGQAARSALNLQSSQAALPEFLAGRKTRIQKPKLRGEAGGHEDGAASCGSQGRGSGKGGVGGSDAGALPERPPLPHPESSSLMAVAVAPLPFGQSFGMRSAPAPELAPAQTVAEAQEQVRVTS